MLSRIALLIALVLAASPAKAQEVAVDLELVLAVDISGSVDSYEALQQRQGYLAAIVHPQVLEAIASGYLQRIAVTYIEWSGPSQQRTVVEWRLIDGPESAQAFVDTLAEAPLTPLLYTSISHAIDYAATLFEGNGFAGARRVIDISGDGPNNSGRPLAAARGAALAAGITINGLPIMNDRIQPFGLPTPNQLRLDKYYEENVIGGPGAFVVVAADFDAFRDAILKKLVLEIAAAPPCGTDGTRLALRADAQLPEARWPTGSPISCRPSAMAGSRS